MAGKLRILEKKIKTEIINVPEIINVTEIINVPDGLPATRGDHVLRRGPARHLPQTPGHREPDPGDPGQPPGQDFLVPMAALRLHRTLKVKIPAPNISSLAASPRTASNLYDDEAPHNICCMNRPAAKITMSIFEPAAILVTSSPPCSKKMLNPNASLRILSCVALVSSPRRIGGTSG